MRIAGSGYSYDGHPFTFWQAILGITIGVTSIATLGLALLFWLPGLWLLEKYSKDSVLESDKIINLGSS